MQDRVSLYPGRVKLEPVAGQANTYDLTRADQPTQEGTPLNKANLLSDATETAMFGAAADRTVDEAFAGLAAQIKLIMSNTAAITLTLKDSAGHALPGVLVQGILTESGQAVYSGTDGVAAGYIAEGSQTIKVTGYADIEDYTETIAVTKGTIITKDLTLTTRNFLKITSSKSVKFSGNVNTVDVTVVGGGGGGGGSDSYGTYGGGGGGGGYCTVTENVSFEKNVAYPAVIGSGGSAGTYKSNTSAKNGGNGGKSSFMGIAANGGTGGYSYDASNGNYSGGAGNGKGGNGGYRSIGYDGVDGGTPGYNSFTTTVKYGGGGGGGYGLSNYTGASETYGKGGAQYGATKHQNATANTGGGGCGGGGSATFYGGDEYTYHPQNGTKGGSGVVTIRMHLKNVA